MTLVLQNTATHSQRCLAARPQRTVLLVCACVLCAYLPYKASQCVFLFEGFLSFPVRPARSSRPFLTCSRRSCGSSALSAMVGCSKHTFWGGLCNVLYCKVVLERPCSLARPFLCSSEASKSSRRAALLPRGGKCSFAGKILQASASFGLFEVLALLGLGVASWGTMSPNAPSSCPS